MTSFFAQLTPLRDSGLRAFVAVSLFASGASSCWLAPTVSAQTDSDSESAINSITEAGRKGSIRRREELSTIQKKMILGDRRHASKDYAGALEIYRNAFKDCPRFSAASDTRQLAFQKYQETVRLYADQQAREGRREDALAAMKVFLNDAREAEILASSLDKQTRWLMEDLTEGGVYEPALSTAHVENIGRIKRLFVLADGYVQLGQFDEATKAYADILGYDPTNAAARRGLENLNKLINNYYEVARDQTRAHMLNQVLATWENPVPRMGMDQIGLGELGLGLPTEERSVRSKLASILIPSVEFEQTPLTEVLRFLSQRSAELDTSVADATKRGINIVLSNDDPDAGSRPISLRLREVPLGAVLSYVTQLARMKYRIDGFAITVVPLTSANSEALITKRFVVPPNFISGGSMDGGEDPFGAADPFADGGGDAGGNATLQKRLTAEEFLRNNGVPFPPGAVAEFLPATSTLLVRNTQGSLDLIEAMVEASFGNVTKMLSIDVKQLEITESELKEIGFDWLLSQFNIPGSDRVFGGGGTYGNTSIAPGAAVATEYPFVPPNSTLPLGRFPLTAGLRTANDTGAFPGTTTTRSPAVFGIGGAFTDPQFQVVLRAMRQKKGEDLMSVASVVTLAGQRAEVRVVREFPYPTEYDPPQVPDQVGSFTLGNTQFIGGSTFGPITPSHPTAFDMREVGSILSVEGSIGADGQVITLSLTPELVRFNGFINYGSSIQQFDTDAITGLPFVRQNVENQILQPIFFTTRETTVADVYDGETLVIGGHVTNRHDKYGDGIPGVQNIPLLGRLFKSEVEDHDQLIIMFFVTVKLIDPAGRIIREQSLTSGSNP